MSKASWRKRWDFTKSGFEVWRFCLWRRLRPGRYGSGKRRIFCLHPGVIGCKLNEVSLTPIAASDFLKRSVVMPVLSDTAITLDYTFAEGEKPLEKKLLKSLSGIAATGDFLWTVSDESRTLECLKRSGDGYAFARRVRLDDFFLNFPGFGEMDELDLESIDIADGHLWLAGSHCRVRVKPLNDGGPNSRIESRKSRRLLGRIALTPDSGALGAAQALPFNVKDPGSLRAHLARNAFLKPFLRLPGKENGLDIEGLAILEGAAFLGLRGPLIDSYAVAVELLFDAAFQISESHMHFINLSGLGIRDLARDGSGIVLIAGPVSDDAGPFKLFRWTPQRTAAVQQADTVFLFPSSGEKPEGLCVTKRNGARGAILLYDNPDKARRIDGKKYSADWLPLPNAPAKNAAPA